jgi:hypothetical protein
MDAEVTLEEDLKEFNDYVNKHDYVFLLDKITELSKIVRMLGRRMSEIEDKLDIDIHSSAKDPFNVLNGSAKTSPFSQSKGFSLKDGSSGRGKRKLKRHFDKVSLKKSIDKGRKELAPVKIKDKLNHRRELVKKMKQKGKNKGSLNKKVVNEKNTTL